MKPNYKKALELLVKAMVKAMIDDGFDACKMCTGRSWTTCDKRWYGDCEKGVIAYFLKKAKGGRQ